MPNEIQKPNKIGSKTSFASRIATTAKQAPLSENVTMKNRIALLLDNSGSMSESVDSSNGLNKTKLEYLKDAVQGFVNAVDFRDTALALYAIPVEDRNTIHMTTQSALIILGSLQLDASGGTPLGSSMGTLLRNESLTRVLIVSDGGQTDGDLCFEAAKQYQQAEIPCDCLHIGSSSDGEATLARIAEITHGTFVKFKDVSQFAKAIHYLTPRYAAMLSAATQSEVAKMLGVAESEVRK